MLVLTQTIVRIFELYALLGLLFAASFLPRAVARLDPRLKESAFAVRVLILPGIAALWPLFAWRWLTRAAEPTERNAHRARARHSMAMRVATEKEIAS